MNSNRPMPPKCWRISAARSARRSSVRKPPLPSKTGILLALHGQGHGPCRIARAAGISRKQVARLLESEGITREPSRPASAPLPEILELRRQGYGFATIGRQLGFSRNAMRRAFRAHRKMEGGDPVAGSPP